MRLEPFGRITGFFGIDLGAGEDVCASAITMRAPCRFSKRGNEALSGTVEWSDVFLKLRNQEEVDVSQCDGAQCGQPSLSENGRLLVFVKATAE